MPQAIAYLAFDGNCAEAMRFYEHALGLDAKIEMMVRAADMPSQCELSAEQAQRIMHCRLRFGDGSLLYAGDAPSQIPYTGIRGVTLTMNYPTVAEAERAFRALSEGGQVTMPPQPAFWAKSCAMLTDRFGTPWVLNGELQPAYAA